MFALGVTDPNTQWDIGAPTLHLTARGFDTLAATLGRDPATGATGYLLKDHLGSTRSLYSATKSPLARLEYTPYGEIHTNLGITTQADITPTFTGKPYDHETRLYYFHYRYYNPRNARWLKRDPEGMIDGPNMYAYVTGNPVSFSDLFGLTALDVGIRAYGGATIDMAGYKQCIRDKGCNGDCEGLCTCAQQFLSTDWATCMSGCEAGKEIIGTRKKPAAQNVYRPGGSPGEQAAKEMFSFLGCNGTHGSNNRHRRYADLVVLLMVLAVFLWKPRKKKNH